MRKIHLYLGCLFAPLLIFYCVSGAFQTFMMHSDKKMGGAAPVILKQTAELHKLQRLPATSYYTQGDSSKMPKPSIPFRYFALAMAVGITITVILGVLLAFQTMKRNQLQVFLILLAGCLLPVILLYLGGGIRF